MRNLLRAVWRWVLRELVEAGKPAPPYPLCEDEWELIQKDWARRQEGMD